jgi:hypothetical protein
MKTLNLNDLLADLEKTAGIEKTASATKPNVSAELSGILEKKASEDITSSALAAGEALAKELLTKMASDAMSLAKGDSTLGGEKKENEIQQVNDAIVAFDNSKIVANEGSPGTGTKPEPGLEGALEGTVEEALKRGAKSDDIVDEKEDKQTKEAQIKSENAEMAKTIMNKIAQIVGVTPTTPAAAENMTPGTEPNLIQHGNEQMTAFDDKKVEALPGAEGSMNSILESIVDRAKAQGAVSEDLVNGDLPAGSADSDKNVDQTDEYEKTAAVSALVEAGCSFDDAIALVKQAEEMLWVEADQQEKVAAITELCASGYDFDTAVELVKQAEAELSGENGELDKVAAVSELIEQGYSYDDAVDLVKQAIDMEGVKAKAKEFGGKAKEAAGKAGEKAKEYAGKVGEKAKEYAGKAGEAAKGAGSKAKGLAGKAVEIAKAHPKAAAGIAAGAAIGAGAAALAHRKHEKKAAFDALIEAGVDFDQAATLVKQAEIDVYGEE